MASENVELAQRAYEHYADAGDVYEPEPTVPPMWASRPSGAVQGCDIKLFANMAKAKRRSASAREGYSRGLAVAIARDTDRVSASNVEIVRRAHELYRSGAFDDAIDRYLDPEIEWETRWPGLQPWFHGKEGVREWVRQAMQPMEIAMELLDARALDHETVLAKYRAHGRGRGSDVPVEMQIFDLLWLRNGVIYRRRTFYSEREAIDAAGSQRS